MKQTRSRLPEKNRLRIVKAIIFQASGCSYEDGKQPVPAGKGLRQSVAEIYDCYWLRFYLD